MEKIAFPSEDGKTIHQHFGRAPLYVVATVHDGGSASFEQRSKAFHGEQHSHAQPHGHSPMFAPISDCQVLIAGGMGQPAFQHAVEAGLKVLMTGEKSITGALDAYLAGNLTTDEQQIHKHN